LLFVYGTPGVTGTVSSGSGTLISTFTVGANRVAQVNLGKTNVITGFNTVENKSITVRTDVASQIDDASYLSREPSRRTAPTCSTARRRARTTLPWATRRARAPGPS